MTLPYRRLLPIAALCMLGILLTACDLFGQSPQGIPGSYLLNPVAGETAASPVAATETASVTAPVAVATTPEPETAEPAAPTSTPSPEPTLTEAPTATPSISPTWDGTPSRTPTRTATPTRTPWPSRTPTITSTPTPPNAALRISRPGPYSRVSSPFRMEAVIKPGADGLVHLEITGEDGRTIHREDMDFRAMRDRTLSIAPEVSFGILAAAETARLSLWTVDEYERTSYLTSVELVLMKIGDDDVFPPASLQERYVIRSPKDGDYIQGGVVHVTGLANLVNENPLLVELLDEDGSVISQTEVTVSLPYGDLSHIPFTVSLPYEIEEDEEPVNARLVFRQESATRIPGTVFLSSLALTLGR